MSPALIARTIATKALCAFLPLAVAVGALQLIGRSGDWQDATAKTSSLLVIATVAWFLFQCVQVLEKVLLSKYDIKAADNLQARKVYTQVHVIGKTLYVIIAIFAAASMLMLFENVRRFGTSILASAGVLGIVVGFAAQRTIANLFAGFQLALAQPIRMDDVVIVEGEWGRIEEFTLTYIVVRIWDERRLVVPLSHFIEKPFQNWTRVSAELMGSVIVWVDYSFPVTAMRPAIKAIVESCKDWDRRLWNLQVTDANERAIQLRVLATASDSSKAWDLRCEIREKLIAFIQQSYPHALPKFRIDQMPDASAQPKGHGTDLSALG